MVRGSERERDRERKKERKKEREIERERERSKSLDFVPTLISVDGLWVQEMLTLRGLYQNVKGYSLSETFLSTWH